jgi:hypothetical protein
MEEKDNTQEGQEEGTVFYYPGAFGLQPDGTLFIMASGYTIDSHWSGQKIVTVNDPDYKMWLWMTQNPKRFDGVSTKDLQKVREEYHQESTPSQPAN